MGGGTLKAFVKAVSHSKSAGHEVIAGTAAQRLSDCPQSEHHTT